MACILLHDDVDWYGSHWVYRAITRECLPKISDPALYKLLEDSLEANICGVDLRAITGEQRAIYTAAVKFVIANAKEADFQDGFHKVFLEQAGYLVDLMEDPAHAVNPYPPSRPRAAPNRFGWKLAALGLGLIGLVMIAGWAMSRLG